MSCNIRGLDRPVTGIRMDVGVAADLRTGPLRWRHISKRYASDPVIEPVRPGMSV